MQNTSERLALVRQTMSDQDLDAFFVPRADEYLGEYVPPYNERLRWISGFTGSAGAVVLLADRAAIFVDGRYTIQVRQQVSEESFEYHHLIDEPPVDWLLEQPGVRRIGIDSRLHTYAWYTSTLAKCQDKQIELVEVSGNPIDLHWQDRPEPGSELALLLPDHYTGESSEEKRTRIAREIVRQGGDLALITQPDSIAWLLNIRGDDVPQLPVVLGFATLSSDGSMVLFTDPRKIPNDLADHVGDDVSIRQESQVDDLLATLSGQNVLADPATANAYCQLRCLDAGAHLVAAEDPVLLPKAQKNPVELNGMRDCHVRDGTAMCRFFRWLQEEVSANRLHDEAVLSDRLYELRAELENMRDLSFDTISAAGPNGAIVHYNHANGEPARLVMDSLYLVDSGGQYLDGTTDVTRTVAIGTPSKEQRRMFTQVLRGNISLTRAVFPRGTGGGQLDALARQHLWREGADYDHGTGHGVGCFLSVHEGPQRISKTAPATPLLPGMVVSNEPGYYKEGEYGIRCENLLAVRELENGMLTFEPLTCVPFDRNLIVAELMEPGELAWLNEYHLSVHRRLSSLLSGPDLTWLEQATAPIS